MPVLVPLHNYTHQNILDTCPGCEIFTCGQCHLAENYAIFRSTGLMYTLLIQIRKVFEQRVALDLPIEVIRDLRQICIKITRCCHSAKNYFGKAFVMLCPVHIMAFLLLQDAAHSANYLGGNAATPLLPFLTWCPPVNTYSRNVK